MTTKGVIESIRSERLTAGLMAAAILVWAVHSVAHVYRKVPVADEADFVLTQESFYQTGVPTLQRDVTEVPRIQTLHPPMWWLVGRVFMQFGLSALAATLATNLLGAAVTLLATFRLAWLVAQRRGSQSPGRVAMLAVGLLGAMPLFQAGSGIIDIDNALLAAVMTLYLVVLFGLWDVPSRRTVVSLGIALGAAWFTKISTPLILVPLTAAVFRLRHPGLRLALGRTLGVVVMGAVMFVTAYVASRPLFAWDWVRPFGHNASRFMEIQQGFDLVMSVRTLAELSIWIGIPAIGITALAGGLLAWRTVRGDVRDGEPLLLLLFTLGIWAVYAYLRVTFNLRYMIPSLGAFAVVAAVLVDERVLPAVRRVEGSPGAWLVASAMVVLALALLPDPYLYLKTRVREDPWGAGFRYIAALAVVTGAIVLPLWGVARRRGTDPVAALATALVACWLVFNLNTSVKQVVGGYQLSYLYGYSEFEGVTSWLQTHVGASQPIFASKAFVWLLKDKPLQVYYQSNMERVWQRRSAGEAPTEYYVVVPVRYARGFQEAWVKVIMNDAERVYANKDFVVVRKRFPPKAETRRP